MEEPNKANRNITGIITGYFLIYVVWGSTYFFIGVALKDLPPFLLGALRFTAAALILLSICHLRGEKIFRRSLIKRSAVSGIVLLFIDMAVVMLAQRYLTSSLVAIIASSTALWILLLDPQCGKLISAILLQSQVESSVSGASFALFGTTQCSKPASAQ